MIKIALDCHGGDSSPRANLEGALAALNAKEDLSLVLCGKEAVIRDFLNGKEYDESRVEILSAEEEVTGEDAPVEAIRKKKESSMVKAISLLAKDESVAGMVSIGPTGVLLTGGVLRVGRLEGVDRPAFCPILPTMNGGIVGICDSGANVDCTPERLVQFAVMGSLYLNKTFGIENPRIALLNVGTETEKGDKLRKETYPLLQARKDLNFVGNMESRDLLSGNYDLVVCDGFSGNVLIKSTEGACMELLKLLKKQLTSGIRNKMGALLLKPALMGMKETLNYQNYGGSVLLGTNKVMVKGHGSSNAVSVEKCILQAYSMENAHLNEDIVNALKGGQENV